MSHKGPAFLPIGRSPQTRPGSASTNSFSVVPFVRFLAADEKFFNLPSNPMHEFGRRLTALRMGFETRKRISMTVRFGRRPDQTSPLFSRTKCSRSQGSGQLDRDGRNEEMNMHAVLGRVAAEQNRRYKYGASVLLTPVIGKRQCTIIIFGAKFEQKGAFTGGG